MTDSLPAPLGLLAELTHRCPLKCPYCSNPLRLEHRAAELETPIWRRVLDEARDLGVLQVHLSGGEPAARRDLEQLVRHCRRIGLYANLITSGTLIDENRLARLRDAGVEHIQLSLQDANEAGADEIGRRHGSHRQKLAFAAAVVASGIPLTINAVVHRRNIARLSALIRLAAELGASRVEAAHAQYHGWALENRAALMPTREQVDRAQSAVSEAKRRYGSRLRIDVVLPDYYARWPKPCMGGWGRRSLNVTPSGKVLPCHAAETVPGLEFWDVRSRSLEEIWRFSPAFEAFRGTDWVGSGCDRWSACRGGCRCQAMAIVGRPTAADPACQLSPEHPVVRALAQSDSAVTSTEFRYRGTG